jgi:hypothetical protein
MIEQIGIAFFGVIAVWLSQDSRPQWCRWACIFGLCSQPFWFMAAWKAEQWGILALCFLYALSWLRGLRTHWLSRWAATRREKAMAARRELAKARYRVPTIGLRTQVYQDDFANPGRIADD